MTSQLNNTKNLITPQEALQEKLHFSKRQEVELEGGAKLTLTGEVLKELPGGVQVLIGGKPLAEQGLLVHGEEVRVAGKPCTRVPLGATQEKKEDRGEAALDEEQRLARKEHLREHNCALNDLEEHVPDFRTQRKAGRVMELELGEDGRMYAHVGGVWPDLQVHGNFYRDENAQPNKPEKPRARRYRGGPMRKERAGSRLGDV